MKKVLWGYNTHEVDTALETLSNQNAALIQHNDYMEDEMKSMRVQLDEAKAAIAAGMTQADADGYKELKFAYAALQEKTRQHEAELEKAKAEGAEDARQQADQALSAAEEAKKAADAAQAQLEQANAENESAREELRNALAEMEILRKELAEAKSAASDADDKIRNSQEVNDKEIENLKADFELKIQAAKEEAVSSRNIEFARLNEQFESEKQKNQDLSEQFETERLKNQNLNEQFEIERLKNQDLNEQFETERLKNQDLNEQFETERLKNQNLNTQIEMEKRKTQNLNEQFETERLKNLDLNAQFETERLKNQNLNQQIETEKSKNQDLKNQLNTQQIDFNERLILAERMAEEKQNAGKARLGELNQVLEKMFDDVNEIKAENREKMMNSVNTFADQWTNAHTTLDGDLTELDDIRDRSKTEFVEAVRAMLQCYGDLENYTREMHEIMAGIEHRRVNLENDLKATVNKLTDDSGLNINARENAPAQKKTVPTAKEEDVLQDRVIRIPLHKTE